MLSPCLTLYTSMLWWFHLSIQQGLLSIFITHYWIAYLQKCPKKYEGPASSHDGAPLSLYFWNTRLWRPPHHIFLSATLFFAQHITHCFTSLEIHSSWVVRRGSNVILIKVSPLPWLFFCLRWTLNTFCTPQLSSRSWVVTGGRWQGVMQDLS